MGLGFCQAQISAWNWGGATPGCPLADKGTAAVPVSPISATLVASELDELSYGDERGRLIYTR